MPPPPVYASVHHLRKILPILTRSAKILNLILMNIVFKAKWNSKDRSKINPDQSSQPGFIHS